GGSRVALTDDPASKEINRRIPMQEHYDTGGVPTEHAVDLAAVEKSRIVRSTPRVTTIEADEIAHANRPSTQMLLTMGRLGKPVYEGTVSGAEKAARRARNKRARAARKVARRA